MLKKGTEKVVTCASNLYGKVKLLPLNQRGLPTFILVFKHTEQKSSYWPFESLLKKGVEVIISSLSHFV